MAAKSEDFSDLISPLRVKEAHYLEVLEGLQEEVATHEALLHKVQSAIKALEAPASNGKAKQVKKKRQSGKPSPGKADVVKALEAVRAKMPEASEGQLREAVEAKIVEAGFSKSGFALRFKEAIAQSSGVSVPA